MIAIIKIGTKQYKVQKDSILKIEKINKKIGDIVEFDNILILKNNENIEIEKKVLAKIINHGKNKKINIIKFRRRKHHIKRQGHRQNFTTIQITNIEQ